MVGANILPAPALQPIAEAAVASTFVERNHPFQGRSTIDLSDALERHPNGAAFKAACGTTTIRNYLLENVVLDANTLLLLKDFRPIAETAYLLPGNDSGHRPELTLTSPLGESEILIVGFNNAHLDYQHWLTQCLPAIDWSLRQTRMHDVRLLLPALQPWQEDLLGLLGYTGIPRLTPRRDALYHLRRVEFSEFINGSAGYDTSQALTGTIQRILNAVPSRPTGDKVLYIRCAKPHYGGIRNEAAVIELLRQHGVFIVDPEPLDTSEHINLFRNADVIIGPSGQYLAGVLFCRPGALLWEWMPRHHQNPTFNRLAQTAQVDYWGDLFENTIDPESTGEWEIDLGIVSRRLAQLTRRTAPSAFPLASIPAPGLGDRPPPHSLALSDLAEPKTIIERERIFNGQSVISLGDALTGHPNNIYYKALATTLTVRNYTLRNVVLDANTLLLLKDGDIISESDYFAPPYEPGRHLIEPPSAPLGDNEVLVFGYNNQHWGYQHWLTQCLPAIDWSLRQTRTHTVRLLLPDLRPWQEDFLRLLGHAEVPRLRPRADAQYDLPRVEISDFIIGSSSFGISRTLVDTIQRILAAAPSHPSPNTLLYIRNPRSHYGAIGNEAAVIVLLRQHGVTIVERERMDTVERINLFRHADAVIGPLGPFLADVLFCRPGALLWEWMPRHYQNHTFNCLAQTAQLDYWGDLFETTASPANPGEWEVDLDIVAQRLTDLSSRLANPYAARTQPAALNARTSLEKLMLRFESLGDNCEFGMVQRKAGAEPLGLLRFNGIRVPEQERLGKLVAGLERRFEGLGDPGTCVIDPTGIELFVSDSLYDFWYHGGIKTGDEDLDAEALRQGTRLRFLRRKFFEDLENGDKILVWRSSATTRREQVQPLMDILRQLGPNTLLWVTEADAGHPPATVEELEPDFLKGYVRRLSTDRQLVDIEFEPWFALCRRIDELRRPELAVPAPEKRP
jgi:capsular polysaccharide biosynthesis protein